MRLFLMNVLSLLNNLNHSYYSISRVILFKTLLICFFPNIIYTQINLIPNNSFEDYYDCPIGAGTNQVNLLDYWYPAGNTPDFFHQCGTPENFSGYKPPLTGEGSVGQVFVGGGGGGSNDFQDEYEYIGVELNEYMIEGEIYQVKFYVSLSWRAEWGTDCIEMFISHNPIFLNYPNEIFIDTLAQISSSEVIIDTVSWTLISGEYTALGGEKYITIGCFKDNNKY
jgi:OmpA-OmpF porin, OOP family